MHARQRERDRRQAGDHRRREERARAHLHLHARLVVLREEPGADGEHEQVERQVEDAAVDERAGAEDGRDDGEADEPDVAEHAHEAEDAAMARVDAQRRHHGERHRGEHEVAQARESEREQDRLERRQLVGAEHRAEHHGGKRRAQDEPRELAVEVGIHHVRLLGDVAHGHDAEQYDHLDRNLNHVNPLVSRALRTERESQSIWRTARRPFILSHMLTYRGIAI